MAPSTPAPAALHPYQRDGHWWFDCLTCELTCGPFTTRDQADQNARSHAIQQHQRETDAQKVRRLVVTLNANAYARLAQAAADSIDNRVRDAVRTAFNQLCNVGTITVEPETAGVPDAIASAALAEVHRVTTPPGPSPEPEDPDQLKPTPTNDPFPAPATGFRDYMVDAMVAWHWHSHEASDYDHDFDAAHVRHNAEQLIDEAIRANTAPSPEPAEDGPPQLKGVPRDDLWNAIQDAVYEFRERTMLWGETEGVTEAIADHARRAVQPRIGALEQETADLKAELERFKRVEVGNLKAKLAKLRHEQQYQPKEQS